MLGAIIGDIAGSLYEFESHKRKDFELFPDGSHLTDDSMMTIAVACACTSSDINDETDFKSTLCWWMRKIGREYPDAGYGGMFREWLRIDIMGPYNSFGNGSAMRVSPVAFAADSLLQAEKLAKWSSEVTHNHPEGIKGAKAIAAAVFLARNKKSKEEIRAYIEENFYKLDFTVDGIRDEYKFDVTCQGSVPQAIQCFIEAEDYEDAIRNAISLGGDGDTQAAMAGAIAEAYYGIPGHLAERGFGFMDARVRAYYEKYVKPLYKL